MIPFSKSREEIEEGKLKLSKRLDTLEMILQQKNNSKIPLFEKEFKL